MTKRITPAEIERYSDEVRDENIAVANFMIRLAEQVNEDNMTLVSVNSSWQDRLAEIEAERDDLNATVELFMNSMDRARELWQDAHPDQKLVWPDGAKNIVWLLEQNDALAAKVKGLEAERVSLWECPSCGFSYNAIHEDVRGGHSCPLCEVAEYESHMKGRVLVKPTCHALTYPPDKWTARFGGLEWWQDVQTYGATAEEALANMRLTIDKEDTHA